MKAELIESRLCDLGMYEEASHLEDSLKEAWAAGIIEGEGSIICTKIKSRPNSYRVCITVTMSDLDIVERLHSIFGVGTITTRKPQKENYKELYVWAVQNLEGCMSVGQKISPFLGKRRKESWRKMVSVLEERLVDRS